MSKTHLAVAIVACLLLPQVSFGFVPYVSGHVGYTIVEDEDMGLLDDVHFDNFVGFGAACGLDFAHTYAHLRLEGEVSYRQNDIDDARFLGSRQNGDGDVSSIAGMANFYYDIENPTFVKPYLMAGWGGTWVSINDVKVSGVKVVDDDQLLFAYQWGAGLGINVSRSVSIDLGYSYLRTSRDTFKDELNDKFKYRYEVHNVLLGVRYRF